MVRAFHSRFRSNKYVAVHWNVFSLFFHFSINIRAGVFAEARLEVAGEDLFGAEPDGVGDGLDGVVLPVFEHPLCHEQPQFGDVLFRGDAGSGLHFSGQVGGADLQYFAHLVYIEIEVFDVRGKPFLHLGDPFPVRF